jgi:hypothetical protein
MLTPEIQGYFNSDITICADWFACANIAVAAC